MDEIRVVSASAEVAAPAAEVFALIADPARQPEWDGNDNLSASTSPRVTAAGDVFEMTNTSGMVRQNHVVAFTEGRRIAWRPSPVDEPQPGHKWQWDVEPVDALRCRVTHIYDWTELTDASRLDRARSTTADNLLASIARLKALAES